jgi:hypothetical protein
MNTIIAWLKSKSYLSHSVAAFAILLAGLITTDPQVRDFITTIFQAHPALGADLVLLAGIIAKYSHSSSPAGTVATAREIVSAPNSPSIAKVDAADTKLQ